MSEIVTALASAPPNGLPFFIENDNVTRKHHLLRHPLEICKCLYSSDSLHNDVDEERVKLITYGYIRINISIEIPLDVIELCFKFFCKKLILPLTDQQLQFRNNFRKWSAFLRSLTDDYLLSAMLKSKHKNYISLIIPDGVDFGSSIRALESKMDVQILLNTYEITQIRKDIYGNRKLNTSQNINVDELGIVRMNDRDFFNHMMISVEKGFEFIRHRKGGISHQVFVVIRNYFLYFKQNEDDSISNEKSKLLHLDKIVSILIGKECKRLNHESLNDIPSYCCFSIIMGKGGLHFSAPNKDSKKVRLFVSYLKGLRRHIIAVKSAMTPDEIRNIRDDIRMNIEQSANTDEMYKIYDVLKLNDSEFVENMMNTVQYGLKFIKHRKRGISDESIIVISDDRLYWKHNQKDRNEKSRSMNLCKIVDVRVGKHTRALQHASFDAISPSCCLSVITERATLDLSSPHKDAVQVSIFISYLKGLRQHAIVHS